MPTYHIKLRETDGQKRSFDLGTYKAKLASEAEKAAKSKYKGMFKRLVTGRFTLDTHELLRD